MSGTPGGKTLMRFAPATLYARNGSWIEVTARLTQNSGLPVTWYGMMRLPPGSGPDLELWSALGPLRLDVFGGPKIDIQVGTVHTEVGEPDTVAFVSVIPPSP
jgi:hypothetical protein